ncbi:zinc dependent phospholipase C family protein [Sphingobacterium spiritivorum]|uniref:zinc dependent phospholipase C family protein n=1 Tax=Sphingobacterium spiritivorum TaxID=258 RepID=UPI003DA42E07
MKKIYLILPGLLICLLCSSWGFYAHKLINRNAVFTLPTELAAFYKQNIDQITEKAVDADKRCYIDSAESPRHFIDLDAYDTNTLDTLPVHWSRAKEKIEEKRLLSNGIVPWQIYITYQKLVKAFMARDKTKIIRHSADLGHYVADAHVPLHTTKNYNGQYTEQIGIHAFWESRLPEMFAPHYKLAAGRAQFITDPAALGWAIVYESAPLADTVLRIEKELSDRFPPSQKKTYLTRNNVLILTYSDAYAKEYHEALNDMVEVRMRKAIHRIGSLWYSAWIEAGQPDLRKLKNKDAEPESILPSQSPQTPMGREEWP